MASPRVAILLALVTLRSSIVTAQNCSSQCAYQNLESKAVDPTTGANVMRGVLDILTVMSESSKGFAELPRWVGYVGSGIFQDFFDVRFNGCSARRCATTHVFSLGRKSTICVQHMQHVLFNNKFCCAPVHLRPFVYNNIPATGSGRVHGNVAVGAVPA